MVCYVKIQKYVIWRNHMILACQNISKAFGTTEIIKNASFHIEEREKAALVGINGAGKSTLLKIIIGEMRADEGEVILSKGKTMGYLAQHQDLTGHLSIYQEVLTAKQNLIDMEERLRQMESDMNTKSGAELDELLSTYTRLSHTFEHPPIYLRSGCQAFPFSLRSRRFPPGHPKNIHFLSGPGPSP